MKEKTILLFVQNIHLQIYSINLLHDLLIINVETSNINLKGPQRHLSTSQWSGLHVVMQHGAHRGSNY